MYSELFEKLKSFDDKEIQSLLKESNLEDVVILMKICDDDLREKILNNMSVKAASLLEERMAILNDLKDSAIERTVTFFKGKIGL